MSDPAAAARRHHTIVVGGGTAGYFAALALKQAFPERAVTLVESSRIPIIGVGEATTTLMPIFLHRQLGIDVHELYRAVNPTWKLGIRFEWGQPAPYAFNYPFGGSCPIEAYAQEGDIGSQSLTSLLMGACRAPLLRDEQGAVVSLLRETKFAYHLENRSFVAFLAALGRRAGIAHLDAEILGVATTPDGRDVAALELADGRRLHGDLYVDATGFRALLIEQALGSPFLSYADSLFCDSAVVGTVPQQGPIEPYTTAETMAAGWCWRIPVEGEDHRGYVFSSAHLDLDQARAEMAAKNPGLRDVWSLRFRSGRHREFWSGNTVAVGNAYGFVEPLESTALHMVIMELRYLIGGLQAAAGGEPDRDFANRGVGAHWDFLRWFLSIHYRFNRRLDSAFWRDCRARVDVSGLQPFLDRFAAAGPWGEEDALRYETGDFAFSFDGLMTLLLGQHAACPPPTATRVAPARWAARIAESRALVARALPQAEALQELRRRPELLDQAIGAPSAWISRGLDEIAPLGPAGGPARPTMDSPAPPAGPYDHLFAPPWIGPLPGAAPSRA